MKAIRPVAAALILTAVLTVPADAEHRRSGGIFFFEPFAVPIPQLPWRNRAGQQDGYPVTKVRNRLSDIGYSDIGQFDVYTGSYGVAATDPGGVRVSLVIDRWSGDIVSVRPLAAEGADRPPPVRAGATGDKRKAAALRVPPLPRPAPGRAAQTATRAQPVEVGGAPETTPPELPEGEEVVTSSIGETDPTLQTDAGGQAALAPSVAAATPEVNATVDVAALPKPSTMAEPVPLAKPAAQAPRLRGPLASAPVTALQGERFDPADNRAPITVY